MIPASWAWTIGAALANHLWQSTLCVAAAAVVARALKRHAASIRYRVWLLASVKFLVPFSLLAGIGRSLPVPSFPPCRRRSSPWLSTSSASRSSPIAATAARASRPRLSGPGRSGVTGRHRLASASCDVARLRGLGDRIARAGGVSMDPLAAADHRGPGVGVAPQRARGHIARTRAGQIPERRSCRPPLVAVVPRARCDRIHPPDDPLARGADRSADRRRAGRGLAHELTHPAP